MSYIKGEVRYQVYYNQNNSYGVLKIDIEETDEILLDFKKTCSVTGYFKQIDIGASYTFNGKMVFHPKYGNTFVCDSYERIMPTSKEGIVQFLSGPNFAGVGKKTAELIVDTLGLDCIHLILNDKNELKKVKKLKNKTIDLIYNELLNSTEVENILITLYSYGITPNFAMRIYDKYGLETLNVIKNNPYQLIDDVDGIAFLRADKIALSTGVNLKSESRIEACISYTIYNYSIETGDTYVDIEFIKNKVINFLNYDSMDIDLINTAFENLQFKNKIVKLDNFVSDIRVYNCEKYVARKLEMMARTKSHAYSKKEIESIIKELEKESNIQYEEEQKNAIISAILNNVSIITGGPGTGKTTIEKGIIYVYNQLIEKDKDLIKLCAPTGKAAKRIEESTGYASKTIHKLLGYDTSGKFNINRFNPLVCKLVIVDEASMIDVFLFSHLLEALPIDSKIVIVGDADQLPSIGPGQVLKDLIDSKSFITTKLKKIHRQKENSKIISLAYDILNETIKTEFDRENDELVFIPTRSNNLCDILTQCVKHFMGIGYSLQTDIEILAPIYKGPTGLDIINKYLQQTFNSSYNFEYKDEAVSFFLDDKVIQLVNQYEDQVMNGDMGIITDVSNDSEIVVDFQGNEVSYKGQDISNIALAYSISIHKSQGSEFPVVILPIFSNYRIMLNKKLIYTAVTRAKEHLVIVGEARALENAIKINSKDRNTLLKQFLSID